MSTPQHEISDLILTRFDQDQNRTYGILEGVTGIPTELTYQGVPVTLSGGTRVNLGFTLEEPWRENRRKISCVPAGVYPIRKHYSGTHGWCIAVDDVPGRDFIQIHIGNVLQDTEGCILLGLKRGKFGPDPGVVNSKITFKRLMKRFSGKGTITIKDVGE